MAGSIKGITVEFNGDTTKLQKALRQMNQEARKTDKELKDINKALKFNPGNTTLLAQKQQVLAQRVGETRNKLVALKNAQKEFLATPGADKHSAEYRQLEREIITTESKLKHFELELKKLNNVKLAALSQQLTNLGQKMRNAGRSMTMYVTTPIAAGLAAATKKTIDFDKAMSQVAATLGKTNKEMENERVTINGFSGSLRELAIEMGSKTAFSATEAAEALNYMALAGYDAQTSAKMLPKVLNLAAAGNMELAKASDMVTDSQSALGLSIKGTNKLIDQMAAASSKSNTSVEQLGEAILTVGGTAKSMKGGTKELTAVLGVLADNGIKGAEGGTALRNILLSLGSPTSKAAAQLKELGVSVYDAQGNMRDMRKIMPELAKALDSLSGEERTKALAAIFNKRDLKSVNALLGTSTERWSELSKAISNSGGAASRMAQTQLDNLGGAITILKSALEGLAINVGDVLTPYIRRFAEWITKLATRFNGMSPVAKKVVVALAAITAAIGPLLLIFGGLASAMGAILSALPMLGVAFAALTGPVGIAAAAIAGCVAAIVLLWKNSETFRKSVKAAWSQIGAAVKEATETIKAAMKSAGVSSNDLKKVFSAIAKFITNVWGSKLGGIIQRVATTIAATIRALASTISAISALMSGDWKKFASNMASATKAMATGIVNAFVPVNKIKQLAQTAANGVRTVFSSMSSSIRSTIASAVNAAGSTWNGIKSKLTTPLNNAYSTVKSALNKIKHLFPMSIGKVFSNLKLPHFKVSGGKAPFGVGGKGSLPHWSVSWYKKGGIFNGPSVIGVGEAGPEAVIPIDRLQQMMNSMADSIVNGIAMNNMVQGAAAGGEITIQNYLFKGGPDLGETVVKTYDQYKKILG